MSIYLDENTVQNLITYREQVFAIAKDVMDKHGIDILANDTLNALSIHEIVKTYDANYNTNFHRNDEDAKSGSVLIENKCATKEPNRHGVVGKSGWQFHAQGKLNYDRYIFAVRRKDNLKIVRLYDITSPPVISAVQNCLADLKQKWINKGKPNHDAIAVPEKLLLDFKPTRTSTINNCAVIEL
jgi:hypothetical protein